jgi:hypothetical protein
MGKELETEGILDYRITLSIGKGIRERLHAWGKNGEYPMRKYLKWIVLGLILAFTVGIEAYKGEGKLPWAIIFAGVVVFFVYSIWRRK